MKTPKDNVELLMSLAVDWFASLRRLHVPGDAARTLVLGEIENRLNEADPECSTIAFDPTEEQSERLQRLADASGISVEALIARCVNAELPNLEEEE